MTTKNSKVKKTALEEITNLQLHLRKDVFPYMTDDEVLNFMRLLKKWSTEMLGSN